MNLNKMVKRVRDYIDEASEKNFTNEFIIDSLNAGQDAVQSVIVAMEIGFFEKPAEINPAGNPPGTTPGVSRYLLPSDFLSFRRVEYPENEVPLNPMDVNEKDDYAPSQAARLMGTVPTANGAHGYYRSGRDMVIWPTPATAFRVGMLFVYRVTRLTTLTAGTFECEIPEEYHDMVCVAAAIDARIKDEASTTDLDKKWRYHKDRLETTLGAWQTQAPKMVGGSKNR